MLILIAMGVLALLIAMEITAINLALAPIAIELNINLIHTHWLVSSYLVCFAIFVMVSGRLGDCLGHRRMLIAGLLSFTFGSWLGGYCHTLNALVIARALQGIGAASVWPSTLHFALSSAADHYKGRIIGLITGCIGLGMAAGPVLAGLLISTLGWQWVFWMNIPISLFILAISIFHIASDQQNINLRTIDGAGIMLLGLFLSCFLLGLDWQKLHLVIMGIIALLILLRVEDSVKSPLLKPELIRNHQTQIGVLSRMLTIMGYYILLFILGIYLQTNLQLNAAHAGMVLLPMTLTIGMLSCISGFVIDRFGATLAILVGTSCQVVAYGLFAYYGTHLNVSLIINISILFAIGFGFNSPGLLSFTLQTVNKQNSGSISGLYYMSSVTAGAIALSIASLLLQHNHASIHYLTANAISSVMLLSLIAALTVIILITINCRNILATSLNAVSS